MTYTVLVTVEVAADSRQEAHEFIAHALRQAKKQEVILLDTDVIEEREDNPEPAPRRPLTRQEVLEGLADRGTDTLEEYRSER
jgi:hypothetical protein